MEFRAPKIPSPFSRFTKWLSEQEASKAQAGQSEYARLLAQKEWRKVENIHGKARINVRLKEIC